MNDFKNIASNNFVSLVKKYCTGRGIEIKSASNFCTFIDSVKVDVGRYYDRSVDRNNYDFKYDSEVVSDEANLPFKDETFDFVYPAHTLENIANPIKALLEWYRVLKGGKNIFLVVSDKRYTRNSGKERTSLEHLIEDYKANVKRKPDFYFNYHFWTIEDVVRLINCLDIFKIIDIYVPKSEVSKLKAAFIVVAKKLEKKLSQDKCNIIVPIKNKIEYVRACLLSIEKYSSYPHQIILVDDGSDHYTKRILSEYAKLHDNVEIITNDSTLGFIKSVNRGLQEFKEKDVGYYLLLNSDTVVTPCWLTKLVAVAESDKKIGIINPLSNMVSFLSIGMSPGDNFMTMNEKIERISQKVYPDIVTASAFCFMITKEAFEKLGYFDEIYGEGYCEDSDYCMRALENGIRVVAADDTYIYHRGKVTFKDREERYKINRKIFDSRWKEKYEELYENYRKRAPLDYLKRGLYTKSPPSIKQGLASSFFKFLAYWQNFGIKHTLKETWGIIKRNEFISYILSSSEQYCLSSPNFLSDSDNRLKATYVLEGLVPRGGALSVVQLVNELVILGVDAKIITCHKDDHSRNFKLYSQPLIYANKRDLVRNCPDADILVATFWTTAYDVNEIVRKRKHIIPFYFIQDYEADFYPKSFLRARERVEKTYELIPNKLVKSDWLLEKLSEDGYNADKVQLGMNLDVFYPHDIEKKDAKIRILAMARPITPRRGFDDIVKVFKRVKEKDRSIEIVFFGTKDLGEYDIPFEYINAGILMGEDLAKLYCSCEVYFDASHFQGFGRTGLEAMACGTACVLTDSGGVREYAEHEYNALIVPVGAIDRAVQSIMRLLEDDSLKRKLVRNGLKTVQRYSIQEAARQHLEIYQKKLKEFLTNQR